MYEETNMAIMDMPQHLKPLKDIAEALASLRNDNNARTTLLFDQDLRVERAAVTGSGYVYVRLYRIDMPEMPYGMRRIYALKQFSTDFHWDESENQLDEGWVLLRDSKSDAWAIREAIDVLDELYLKMDAVYDKFVETGTNAVPEW